jgi:pimeloyl-ACP methyl ester carboxylesterase
MAEIDRAFIRLSEGLVHYRHAGAGLSGQVPLYMVHGGPGSSRGLAPLVAELGERRWTIAPDMLGNGDSAAPATDDTDIAYYADCVIRIIDALDIAQVDFFGSHTGAMIGLELSRRHGDRVRRIVLDGVLLLAPGDRQRMVDLYAPEKIPDDHGGYLSWAYQFARDMALFFPHFDRDAAHRLPNGVAPSALLHLMVVDILKALTTYHRGYRAAFAYDAETALRAVRHPTLLTSSSRDALHVHLPVASGLLPAAAVHLHGDDAAQADVAAVIDAFLQGDRSSRHLDVKGSISC